MPTKLNLFNRKHVPTINTWSPHTHIHKHLSRTQQRSFSFLSPIFVPFGCHVFHTHTHSFCGLSAKSETADYAVRSNHKCETCHTSVEYQRNSPSFVWTKGRKFYFQFWHIQRDGDRNKRDCLILKPFNDVCDRNDCAFLSCIDNGPLSFSLLFYWISQKSMLHVNEIYFSKWLKSICHIQCNQAMRELDKVFCTIETNKKWWRRNIGYEKPTERRSYVAFVTS